MMSALLVACIVLYCIFSAKLSWSGVVDRYR